MYFHSVELNEVAVAENVNTFLLGMSAREPLWR